MVGVVLLLLVVVVVVVLWMGRSMRAVSGTHVTVVVLGRCTVVGCRGVLLVMDAAISLLSSRCTREMLAVAMLVLVMVLVVRVMVVVVLTLSLRLGFCGA